MEEVESRRGQSSEFDGKEMMEGVGRISETLPVRITVTDNSRSWGQTETERRETRDDWQKNVHQQPNRSQDFNSENKSRNFSNDLNRESVNREQRGFQQQRSMNRFESGSGTERSYPNQRERQQVDQSSMRREPAQQPQDAIRETIVNG